MIGFDLPLCFQDAVVKGRLNVASVTLNALKVGVVTIRGVSPLLTIAGIWWRSLLLLELRVIALLRERLLMIVHLGELTSFGSLYLCSDFLQLTTLYLRLIARVWRLLLP